MGYSVGPPTQVFVTQFLAVYGTTAPTLKPAPAPDRPAGPHRVPVKRMEGLEGRGGRRRRRISTPIRCFLLLAFCGESVAVAAASGRPPCEDSSGWTVTIGGKTRGCSPAYCDETGVEQVEGSAACPEACGACPTTGECEDSKSFRYKGSKCSKLKKKQHLCEKKGEEPVAAATACGLSCGNRLCAAPGPPGGACAGQASKSSCKAVAGCKWKNDACKTKGGGGGGACKDNASEDSCEKVAGCKWKNDKCKDKGGGGGSCKDNASEDSCNDDALGCKWKNDKCKPKGDKKL